MNHIRHTHPSPIQCLRVFYYWSLLRYFAATAVTTVVTCYYCHYCCSLLLLLLATLLLLAATLYWRHWYNKSGIVCRQQTLFWHRCYHTTLLLILCLQTLIFQVWLNLTNSAANTREYSFASPVEPTNLGWILYPRKLLWSVSE